MKKDKYIEIELDYGVLSIVLFVICCLALYFIDIFPTIFYIILSGFFLSSFLGFLYAINNRKKKSKFLFIVFICSTISAILITFWLYCFIIILVMVMAGTK